MRGETAQNGHRRAHGNAHPPFAPAIPARSEARGRGAQEYLDYSSVSCSGVIDELDKGYTPEQVSTA
jgi:hypothetical protein